METTDTIQSDAFANSTKPSAPIPESPPIAIQGRIGLAMFLIIGFLLGMTILMELLSAIFR
jgi:hypothetical protein